MFKGGRRLPRIKYCGDTEDNLWQVSKKKREKRTVALSFLPGSWAPSRSKPRPPAVWRSCDAWPHVTLVPNGRLFFFFKFSHFNFPPSSHDHLDLQSNKDDSVGLEDGCAGGFHTWMREDSPPDEQRGRFAKIYIYVKLCFYFRLCFWKTEIVFAFSSELIWYKTEN